MNVKRLPRTLFVGLGGAGGQVVASSLARLADALGPVGVVTGIVVQAAEAAGTEPDRVLSISPEGAFDEWRAELSEKVVAALHRVSHLSHLTTLAERGLGLSQAGEVHLILVADLGESWALRSLTAVAGSLRDIVHHTLSCESSLTGLLLLPAPADVEPPLDVHQDLPGVLLESPTAARDALPGGLFDQGCFLASPTNEAGLLTGDGDDLARRAAHFLALLMTSPLGAAVTEAADVGSTGSSFGLVALRWPGKALVSALSARRAKTALTRLITPVAGEEERAATSASGLVAGECLAPPFLVEKLSAFAPAFPHDLSAGVPGPPWPWQLAGVKMRLESAAQAWEEDWCAAREPSGHTLSEMRAAWQASAPCWLERQVTWAAEGVAQRARAHLQAVAGLLEAFIEGVEVRLEETEADLVAVERQTTPVASSLQAALASLPDSPLATLLAWGPWPLSWLRRWRKCRQVQATARRYARLLRTRLVALHTLWSYEMALDFYRELLAAWGAVAATWKGWIAQVTQAADAPALSDWQQRLESALATAGGPWTLAMVEEMYQAAHHEIVEGQDISRWIGQNVAAGEIVRQLRTRAAGDLAPLVAIPADLALVQRWPDKETLSDWLAAFVAQACPFLHFDETTLSEEARAGVRLDSWLFLPGAERSPLADLFQTWPRPPALLPSQDPEEIVAVIVRHGLSISCAICSPSNSQGGLSSSEGDRERAQEVVDAWRRI